MSPQEAGRNWYLWARNTLLALVILAFIAFFGLPSPQATPGAVAEVAGETIDREVFEFFRDQLQADPALQQGDPDAQREILDARTLEAVIQRQVRSLVARELGLEVGDREVRAAILENPNFRPGGVFDRETFERYAVRQFGTPRQFSEQLRLDLLNQKLERLVRTPLRVPEVDAREAVARGLLTISLRFAAARQADFEAGLEITDEQAARFAELGPDRVREQYERRSFEFAQEESVTARHILFESDPADPQAASARATTALERLRAGEDFAAVARELSDDEATREQGGDLGTFPRGRMMPELEEAAFALEVNEISDPVTSSRGIHLIQVLAHVAGTDGGFEAARIPLAKELARQDAARDRAREAAAVMARRLAAGEDFEAAAAASGLEVEVTPPFRYADPLVPGIGRVDDLREAAFALTPENPSSAQVFTTGDSFLLISLLSRQEPDAEAVDAQVGPLRERMELVERRRLAERLQRRRRDQLQRDGEIAIFPLYPSS